MAMTTQATYGGPATKRMKLEHESLTPSTPQPTTNTTSTTTHASTYSTTAQWNAPIPIDPALTAQPSSATTTTGTAQTQCATPATMAIQATLRTAPIMNYQHYQAYGATHYPQYTPQHYAQYQPTQTATIPTAPATTSTTTNSAAPLSRQNTQTANEEEQNADISTLNDAVGSAGLDLRAEEETLQRSQDYYSSYRSYEDRSRRQPNSPAFDTRILGTTMRNIGTSHKVARIPEDAVNYLALALRSRLQTLVVSMIDAAQHRTTAQFNRTPSLYEDGTPMWSIVVRRDLKKQLEVLERTEREEEMKLRRERRERADAAAAAAAAQAGASPQPDGTGTGTANGDDTGDTSAAGGKKAKKKKDGPGVTAKNMSEDVQKRLSNATAAQAAGLGRGRYAWMNAGAAAASSPSSAKPKASTSASASALSNQSATAATQSTTATSQPAATPSSWSKPYVLASQKASQSPAPGDEDRTIVTIRDAMFVVEGERGHGAGRGAARGWV